MLLLPFDPLRHTHVYPLIRADVSFFLNYVLPRCLNFSVLMEQFSIAKSEERAEVNGGGQV